ncbi:hypothetical protein BV898_08804 [Hypsibius exemplaris]|uniref:Uncharacterized protein n=1 Tax=Hypsibius exemplaris TaxID=2072580 RepID=A0A1W0WPF2_HYPEX|nr:hypothetical protein BV898_08804 [Hypsibius exemplaris]
MSLHVILTDMPAPAGQQSGTGHARSPDTTNKNWRTPNGSVEVWVAKYVIESALSPVSGLNDIDAARRITEALKEREMKNSGKEWFCVVARAGMSAISS